MARRGRPSRHRQLRLVHAQRRGHARAARCAGRRRAQRRHLPRRGGGRRVPRARALAGPRPARRSRDLLELVRQLGDSVPILGICLGHQVLAEACGGRIVRARRPLHGTTSEIRKARAAGSLLARLPRTFQAARYHSLVVDPARPGRDLVVTCRSAEGEIMGLRHRRHPLEGVQFHPESFLTPHGPAILAAFLGRAGVRAAPPQAVVR